MVDYKSVRNTDPGPPGGCLPVEPRGKIGLVVVVEPEASRPGAIVTIVVVVLFLLAIVILFIGLGGLHWFGFNHPAVVGTAPSQSPPPPPSPSAS